MTHLLTLPSIERHWAANSREFLKTYAPWCSVYADLLKAVGEILYTLEGRRQLAENCTYLMLSKAINHSLSTYALITRGLIIDAALSARNSMETLLLLQLCVLDPSENLYRRWSNGESFKPSWVRKALDKLSDVVVRDVVVSKPSLNGEYALSYKWLSDITHANLASLNETVIMQSADNIRVTVGGSTVNKEATINAIFSILCFTLLITGVLCGSVFSLSSVEDKKDRFDRLQKRIDQTAKSYLTKLPSIVAEGHATRNAKADSGNDTDESGT
jgi:hypothetical protein